MPPTLILTKFGVSFWLALLPMFAGILVLSLVVGWVCFKFRLREFYFAVVTLAFSELARLIVLNWNSVTNGTRGPSRADKPTLWLPGTGVVKIEGTQAWYLLTLTSLLAATALSHVLVRSWIGRNFAAIRLNEDLAQTLGYQHVSLQAGGVHGLQHPGRIRGCAVRLLHELHRALPAVDHAVARRYRHGPTRRHGVDPRPVVGAFLLTGLPHVIEFSAELRAAAYGAI